MIEASTCTQTGPDLLEWQVFSAEHRVELTSHAVRAADQLYIFDPVPLAKEAGAALLAENAQPRVVLTNENHERAALRWQQEWQLPVWVPPDCSFSAGPFHVLPEGEAAWECWQVLPVLGGAPGERAFHLPERDLMVFGDAIINLPGRGLEILPTQYCQDPGRLRESLRRLCEHSFDTLVSAHGRAVTGNAADQVRSLLERD